MGKHVFISYSSHDAKIAFKIVEYLEQNGIECWIAPRNIESGLDYTDVINNAIEECSALVLVFSTASVQSQFVKKELTTAVSFNKTILPFKISKVDLKGGFLFLLNNVQWIDATSHPESNFPLILNRLSKENNSSTPLPPVKPKNNGNRWIIIGIVGLLALGAIIFFILKGGTPPSGEGNDSIIDTVSPMLETPIDEKDIHEEGTTLPTKKKDPKVEKTSTKNVEKNSTKAEESSTEAEKTSTETVTNTDKAETPTIEAPADNSHEQIKEDNTTQPTTKTQSQADSREARMKKANSYYNQGKYGPALKIYEKLKQENPSDKSLDKLIKECREKQ
jgi:hypothetical protein